MDVVITKKGQLESNVIAESMWQQGGWILSWMEELQYRLASIVAQSLRKA